MASEYHAQKPSRTLGPTSAPVSAINGRATYADYAATPDGERWELLRGTLVREPPSPGYYHQTLLERLHRQITERVPETGPIEVLLAPFDVVLAEDTVVQPDVLIFQANKLVTRRGLEEPPDLAIEILSPHSVRRDLKTKRSIYSESGVKEYWVIDPEARRVLQVLLQDSAGMEGSVVRDVTVPAPSDRGDRNLASSPPTLQSVIFPSVVIRLDRLFYPFRNLGEKTP